MFSVLHFKALALCETDQMCAAASFFCCMCSSVGLLADFSSTRLHPGIWVCILTPNYFKCKWMNEWNITLPDYESSWWQALIINGSSTQHSEHNIWKRSSIWITFQKITAVKERFHSASWSSGWFRCKNCLLFIGAVYKCDLPEYDRWWRLFLDSHFSHCYVYKRQGYCNHSLSLNLQARLKATMSRYPKVTTPGQW